MRKKVLESESLPEFDEGIKNMDDYSKGKVDATLEQATIWYERMGKFAEWVRGEGFQYLGGIWSSYKYNRSFTTPELVNEFLKIK